MVDMKFIGPLIVVEDMERSLEFYCGMLGQKVRFDLGANQQLECGLMLQTKASWQSVSGVDTKGMLTGAKNMELYFEVPDFDGLLDELRAHSVTYLHDVVSYDWGQRSIALYDPDGYIVDIGESMPSVIRRFLKQGMTAEQVAEKTEHPLDFVRECML